MTSTKNMKASTRPQCVWMRTVEGDFIIVYTYAFQKNCSEDLARNHTVRNLNKNLQFSVLSKCSSVLKKLRSL